MQRKLDRLSQNNFNYKNADLACETTINKVPASRTTRPVIKSDDPVVKAYQAFHSVPYERLVADYLLRKEKSVDNLITRLWSSAQKERDEFAEHVYALYIDIDRLSLSARDLVILGLAHQRHSQQDEVAALTCFDEAAEKENDDALLLLGMHYFCKNDLLNHQKADQYLNSAIEKGNMLALCISTLYLSEQNYFSPYVNLDKTVSAKLLQSTEQGCAWALYTLAGLYFESFKSTNIEKDIEKSLQYAEEAIRRGLGPAFRLLAGIYIYTLKREQAFPYLIKDLEESEKNPDPEDSHAEWNLHYFCENENDVNKRSFYYRYIIEHKFVSLKEWAEASLWELHQSYPNHLVVCYHAAFGLTSFSQEKSQTLYAQLSHLLFVSKVDDLNMLIQQEPLSLTDIRFRKQLAVRIETAFHCLAQTVLPPEIISNILAISFGHALSSAVINGSLLNTEREEERSAYLKLATLEKKLDLPPSASKSVISTSILQTLWGDNKKRKISIEQKRETALLNIKSARDGTINYTEALPRYAKKR